MSVLAEWVPQWNSMADGEFVDLHDLSPLHQIVRPLARVVDNGVPEIAGSAVHMSAKVPTALATARHVFHGSLTKAEYKDRDIELFVCWTPPAHEPADHPEVRGWLTQVWYYEDHACADLAALSLTERPPTPMSGPTFPLSLRMPRCGERVAVIGYPGGSLRVGGQPGNPPGLPELMLAADLRVSVGRVTQQQPERLDIEFDNPRTAPGFYTDAPAPSGMSGGAVVDEDGSLLGLLSRSSNYGSVWRSYVALAGDMLGLLIRIPAELDGSAHVEGPIEAMLGANKLEYTVDPASFKVIDGKPVYSAVE